MVERLLFVQGAITTLKEKSVEQLKAAKTDLEETRKKLQEEVGKLRSRASSADTTIQSKSRELHILLHYKEKEYPIRYDWYIWPRLYIIKIESAVYQITYL